MCAKIVKIHEKCVILQLETEKNMRNRILAELGEARVENGEMTFGELKDLVPAVRPGKLPNAKKLADEAILIERHTEDVEGLSSEF